MVDFLLGCSLLSVQCGMLVLMPVGFFACLRPITLQPAPVSTSQSICSISESFDIDIHAGQMCSEFLSLSQQTPTVSLCIILLRFGAYLFLFAI